MIKKELISLLNRLYLIFRKDIRTKSIIFLVGIVLWFSINLEKNFETAISVPIKITNIKKGKVLKNPLPKYAKILIRGKGKVLFFSELNRALYFELDVENVRMKKSFKLDRSLLVNQSLADITLLSVVTPQFLDVELDQYSQKRVPVELRSIYTVKSGFLLSGETTLGPDSVLIKGPLSKVHKIDRLYTEEMVDSNLTKDIRYEAKLLLVDTPAVIYSHKVVKVFQKVSKKGSNSFKCLVRLINFPQDKEIMIDPVSVSVEVYGPVDQLYEIDQEKFTITADYLKINESDMSVELEVKTDINLQWQISNEKIKIIEL